MAVYPKPLTAAYTAFINAATFNEPFRQALYNVYGKHPGSAEWNAMKKALTDNSVCAPGQETPLLNEIVKVDWKEVNQIELKLGRGPEDDGAVHPLMG